MQVVCLLSLMVYGISKKPPKISLRGLILKDGGYLLSHKSCSTIGAIGLNFSVRNGKRWIPNAIAT